MPPPIEERYAPPPQPPSVGLSTYFDPTRIGVGLMQTVSLVAVAVWATYWFSNEVSKRDRRIDSVEESIVDLRSFVKDQFRRFEDQVIGVNKKVVGKTPEGFHRRDCQDLINAIEIAIASQVASSDYDEEAWPANSVILRAIASIDCYKLQGHKSRIAQNWNTIVQPK
jgi:hypothetical protein